MPYPLRPSLFLTNLKYSKHLQYNAFSDCCVHVHTAPVYPTYFPVPTLKSLDNVARSGLIYLTQGNSPPSPFGIRDLPRLDSRKIQLEVEGHSRRQHVRRCRRTRGSACYCQRTRRDNSTTFCADFSFNFSHHSHQDRERPAGVWPRRG